MSQGCSQLTPKAFLQTEEQSLFAEAALALRNGLVCRLARNIFLYRIRSIPIPTTCFRTPGAILHAAQPALSDHALIHLCAGPRFSSLGCGIKFVKSKAQVPALIPFKIIRQRPVEIPAQINSL